MQNDNTTNNNKKENNYAQCNCSPFAYNVGPPFPNPDQHLFQVPPSPGTVYFLAIMAFVYWDDDASQNPITLRVYLF